jgi:hypothetical protein
MFHWVNEVKLEFRSLRNTAEFYVFPLALFQMVNCLFFSSTFRPTCVPD